jgi:hypothetical protein
MALTPLFTDGCETCSTSYAETGVLSSSNLYVEILLPIDAATLALQVTGSWSATLLFEGTINGDDWFAAEVQPLPSGLLVASTTTNGVWQTNVAGFSKFRVRTTAITNEATVSIRVTSGPATLPVSTESTTSLSWSRTAVTLTGADDQVLLAADASRRAVIFYNRTGNSIVRYDIAGQSINAAADEGIPLIADNSIHSYSGQDTPTGTVTVTGTAGNIVTVYTAAV